MVKDELITDRTRLLWDFESGRGLLLPTRPSVLAAESAGDSARVAMTACMSLRFNCSRSFRLARRLWDLECRERANCKSAALVNHLSS